MITNNSVLSIKDNIYYDESMSAVTVKYWMRSLIIKWKFLFTFEQLPLRINPLSQSIKLFNQNVIFSSSKILKNNIKNSRPLKELKSKQTKRIHRRTQANMTFLSYQNHMQTYKTFRIHKAGKLCTVHR